MGEEDSRRGLENRSWGDGESGKGWRRGVLKGDGGSEAGSCERGRRIRVGVEDSSPEGERMIGGGGGVS